MKMMLEEVAKERLSRIGLQPSLQEPLGEEGITERRVGGEVWGYFPSASVIIVMWPILRQPKSRQVFAEESAEKGKRDLLFLLASDWLRRNIFIIS